MIKIPKTLRRIIKICIRTIEVVLAFLIVGIGLLLGRLFASPLEVKEFLPTLEKYIMPADSGLTLNADSLTLRAAFNNRGILHIAVQNLKLLKSDGRLALRLPEVDISYNLWSILSVDLTPDNLTIKEASLHLSIDENGQWHLYDASKENGEDIELNETGVVLERNGPSALDRFVRQILSFDSLSLIDARIKIHDRQKKDRFSIPALNLEMERQPGLNHAIRATATVQIQNDLTELLLEAQLNRTTRKMSFDVEFDTIELKNLSRFIPVLKEADLAVGGHIKGIFDFGNTCQDVLSCFSESRFQFKTKREGTLNLPAPLTNLYRIESATINGAVGTHLSEIKIAKSTVQLKDGPKASLEVTVSGIQEFLENSDLNAVKTVLKSSISSLPIEDVPGVWPKATGPDAHAWVQENLSEGMVEQADFTLYFTGDELVDLYGELPVQNIRVRYLDEMSPVNNFNGLVKLWPDRVLITGNEASIGDLKLKDATIDLTELQETVSHAKINLVIEGPVRDAMRLIAEKPLEFPQMFDLNPDVTGGNATVTVDLSFPLIDNLTTEQVKAFVKADITGGIFPTPLDNLNLTDGKLQLTVDNRHLDLNGTGIIKEIELNLKWTEYFTAKKSTDTQSEYNIKTLIRAEQLKPFIDHIEAYLDGSFTVQADLKELVSGHLSGKADFNFEKANLTLYPLSIDKPRDVPMKADISFDLNQDMSQKKGRFNITGFTDTEKTQELSIIGNVDWGKSLTLNLDKAIAPKTNAKGTFQLSESGNISLTLSGDSLNLSGLYKNPVSEDNNSRDPYWPTDLTFDIRLKQLFLDPELPLKDTKLIGEKRQNLWKKLSVTTSGDKMFQVVFLPQNNRLTAKTDNFGDLLLRLGITKIIEGGELNLKALQQKNGGFEGTMDVNHLSLKEPGFLVQAFTILGIVDAIRGKDLVFETAHVPFHLESQPSLSIQLTEAYLSGTNLGITFDGKTSIEALALNGSVIPAYAINSLPGKIPLIGELFKDGAGGGLIGVKYEITGPLRRPEVTFNPLGSIAPGILGKLFK